MTTNGRELYGDHQDDLDPDEPRDQARITGRKYWQLQEGVLPLKRPTEAIIGRGFFEYIGVLQRKRIIRPWEGTVNEKIPLEVWRDLEGALYNVFIIELRRDCGIVLNEEMVEKGWKYYQNM